MKLSFIIWCIVGCRIPSDEIFAEKYETKEMRKEYLWILRCVLFFILFNSNLRF
jgi:hypothetical protein